MSAIIYLLQVSGCMAIFYLFYYLMLRRLTFFTINRYYLLITLALSFVVPLLTIHTMHYEPIVHIQQRAYVSEIRTFVIDAKANNTTAMSALPVTDWIFILKTAYETVAAALFIRLLITLITFFIKLKDRKIERVGNIRILHGNKKLNNGSFLNYIFLNGEELSSAEIQQVLAHEMLHVKLFHSFDRIVAKMVQIILWFNPVAYLYTSSMEENHEFEVDRNIVKSVDKIEYADLLLHLSVAANGLLYNNFSKAPLKKRIIMLFNQPSANVKRAAYVLVAPLVLLSCLAFATFKKEINPQDAAGDQANTGSNFDNNDTARRVSAIAGTGNLGRNPLVIIDGKEYSSDILYKISRSCTRAVTVWKTQAAVEKYGLKASDGCVSIKTKNGQITYMSAIERENLVKEALVPKSKYYTRLVLKNTDGSLYDKVIIKAAGSWASTEISHGAKVAFFIDQTFYDEDAIKKLPATMVASLSPLVGVQDLVKKEHPELDLHGFEAIFLFSTNGVLIETDNLKYPWKKPEILKATDH